MKESWTCKCGYVHTTGTYCGRCSTYAPGVTDYHALKSTEGLVESGDLTDPAQLPAKSLGRIAYEGGRSLLEKLSPNDDWWSDLTTIDKRRWEAAAQAVASQVLPRWTAFTPASRPQVGKPCLIGRGSLEQPDVFEAFLVHKVGQGDQFTGWTHWYPIEEPRP